MTTKRSTLHRDVRNVLAFLIGLSVIPSALSATNVADVDEVQSIARLYSAAFDRSPENNGLNFWVDTYESGFTLPEIAAKFSDSPEFRTKYGELTDGGFIDRLYSNVLGRDGHQGGIDFWIKTLGSGKSRGFVLSRFADSPENIVKTAQIFGDMHMKGGQWLFDTGYAVAYWKQLAKELKTDTFSMDSFLYTDLPNVTNCDPGTLTEAAKYRARDVLNAIRSLHNLPKTIYDFFYDPDVLSAALIQRANDYINHDPEPEDLCYSMLGAEGSNGNIGLNYYHNNADPASDIVLWLNDRSNVHEVSQAGHRRWVLYPELGYISYGQVYGASVQKVHSFGVMPQDQVRDDLQFVAFPYETYPYFLAIQDEMKMPWSISMTPNGDPNYQYAFFGNANVSVTEIDTGLELTVNSLYTDTDAYGVPNFLSWVVDGYDYDTNYLVEISDIRMPDGSLGNLNYNVYLDYYNIVDLTEALEPGDSSNGSELQGSFSSRGDKDSYVVSLAGNTVFNGESVFANQGFFILLYDDRKRLIRSSDQAFQHVLNAGDYTVVVSLCDENSWCYYTHSSYTVSIEQA